MEHLLLHDGVRVVTDDAPAGGLAGKAALAKANVFARQRNDLHLVARLTRALGELLRQQVGI